MQLQALRIYPFYCAGLLCTALFSWLTALLYRFYPVLETLHWFLRLLPAPVLSICALILHICSHRRSAFYLTGYVLNTAASGFAIGTLLRTKLLVSTAALLPALIPAAVLGFLTCVLLTWGRNYKKFFTICLCLLGLAFTIFGLRTMAKVNTLVGCVFMFSGLFFLPFPIFCAKLVDNPEDLMRYLSFSGFGAFMVIFFVVLLFLTEGEALEVIDVDIGTSGSSTSLPSRKGKFSKHPNKLETVIGRMARKLRNIRR